MKSVTSASRTWDVDLVTGQIATLIEEDRYVIASVRRARPLSLLVAKLAASLHQIPCDE